jgi:sodium/proline symporter
LTGDGSIFAGLLLYLAMMLVVGIVSSRYMKSLDDYVLGGRRLGPWVSAISERASGESAWFLLGLPGAAYGAGFVGFWSVIGIASGILFSWTFIAIPLRRQTAAMGALTIPDYFEMRFGDRSRMLRLFSTIAILVFYTAYLAAQLNGAGMMLEATFDIPVQYGLLIGAAVVLLYTMLGGFLAVAWTDLIQGILMTCVAVVLPIVGLIHVGGFGRLAEALQVRGDGFLSMSGGQAGSAFLFGVVVANLSWGLGYLGQPHLLTRYMAIRKTRELPKSGAIAMGWTLVSYWGAPFIGIVGVAVLGPDLANHEQVMPLLALALMPGWLAGLMIAGATAAMMSSADSQLLVASSAVVEDICVRLLKIKASAARLVLLSRTATMIIAAIALYLAWSALNDPRIIDTTVSYAWTGLGASFGPPLLLALWWKRTSLAGVLCGMVGGMGATILWKNVDELGTVLDIKAAAVLISALLVVSVSLWGNAAGAERTTG